MPYIPPKMQSSSSRLQASLALCQPLRSLRLRHVSLENLCITSWIIRFSNAVVTLAIETAISGHGALLFCGNRQGCQTTAVLISDAMPIDQISTVTLDKRYDLMASLQALPGGFEATFSKTILCGVAFHHAGTSIDVGWNARR